MILWMKSLTCEWGFPHSRIRFCGSAEKRKRMTCQDSCRSAVGILPRNNYCVNVGRKEFTAFNSCNCRWWFSSDSRSKLLSEAACDRLLLSDSRNFWRTDTCISNWATYKTKNKKGYRVSWNNKAIFYYCKYCWSKNYLNKEKYFILHFIIICCFHLGYEIYYDAHYTLWC